MASPRPLGAYPAVFSGIAASAGGLLFLRDMPWSGNTLCKRWYDFVAAKVASGDERARGPWRVVVGDLTVEITRVLPRSDPPPDVEVLKRVLDKPLRPR